MKKGYKLNYSDEEFIPCRQSIFIKRFGKDNEKSFSEYEKILCEFLEEFEFEGVCYIGKERGKVLEEYIDQEVWEKSIALKAKCFVFWLSDANFHKAWQKAKDDILYLENVKSQSIRRIVLFNGKVALPDSEEDVKNLKELIKKACSLSKKE